MRDLLDAIIEYKPDLINLSECMYKIEEILDNLKCVNDLVDIKFQTENLKKMIQMKMGQLTQEMMCDYCPDIVEEEVCDKKCDCKACE
jgi:ABC-type enterochelin transport system substrate-binding protein